MIRILCYANRLSSASSSSSIRTNERTVLCCAVYYCSIDWMIWNSKIIVMYSKYLLTLRYLGRIHKKGYEEIELESLEGKKHLRIIMMECVMRMLSNALHEKQAEKRDRKRQTRSRSFFYHSYSPWQHTLRHILYAYNNSFLKRSNEMSVE